jgi:hypothetical protein
VLDVLDIEMLHSDGVSGRSLPSGLTRGVGSVQGALGKIDPNSAPERAQQAPDYSPWR